MSLVKPNISDTSIEFISALRQSGMTARSRASATQWIEDSIEDGVLRLRLFVASEGTPLSSTEHGEWCRRAEAWCQAHPDLSPLTYVNLRRFTRFSGTLTLPEVVATSEQTVQMSQQLGSDGREIRMRALMDLAAVRASLYQPDEVSRALAEFQEAETILDQLDAEHLHPERAQGLKGLLHYQYARLANRQGRHVDAKRHAMEGIRLKREVDQRWSAWGGLLEWGEACLRLGEFAQAREIYLEAQKIQDDLDRTLLPPQPGELQQSADSTAQSNVKCYLGIIELRLGNVQVAKTLCQASIREALKRPAIDFLANALGLAAGVAAMLATPSEASTLSGASQALFASTGRAIPWEDFSLDALFPGWSEGPDAQALQAAFERGQAMGYAEAAEFALSIS
jgi:hypothetical protein